MANPTAPVADPPLADLERRYAFRDREQVAAFLAGHPHLVPLLHEAADQIARSFGAATPLALEVVVDREVEDQQQLFALIETDMSVVDARRRLDDFDAAWWLDVVDRARGNLTIEVEPRAVAGGVRLGLVPRTGRSPRGAAGADGGGGADGDQSRLLCRLPGGSASP